MRFRTWSILLLLLVLPLSLTLPVSASENEFVFDEAGILTSEEGRLLEKTAAGISVRYGCGTYIVTVWDYADYGSSARSAAENYYLSRGFGLGSDASGVMLLLSMAERDYALIAHGDMGNGAFTDYGKDVLSEEFLDDFRYDAWFDGFEDYLSTSERMLAAASGGAPVDVGQGSSVGVTLVMILLAPAAIAGIVCGIMVASMKSAAQKTHADDYRQCTQLTAQHDRFLTRTVVRQKIESSSSSGGTKVNSGGFSGKSGKF